MVRALLHGERTGSLGVVAGLTGVICLLIASIGLNIKHSHDLAALKSTIISRCELRQAADARERDDLQARINLYASLITAEQLGPNPASRVPPYREAMDKARATLDGMPRPVDCALVYADSR